MTLNAHGNVRFRHVVDHLILCVVLFCIYSHYEAKKLKKKKEGNSCPFSIGEKVRCLSFFAV